MRLRVRRLLEEYDELFPRLFPSNPCKEDRWEAEGRIREIVEQLKQFKPVKPEGEGV